MLLIGTVKSERNKMKRPTRDFVKRWLLMILKISIAVLAFLCRFLLPVLLLVFLVAVPLLFLDKYHLQVDHFFESRMNITNYFKGEIWFAVVATCIAALPGMYFGLLALNQTRINFRLENRYHRPSIRLNLARIIVDRIHDRAYTQSQSELFRRYVEKLQDVEPQENLITCIFDIEVLNDIEVENIILKKLDFYLGSKVFSLKISDSWKEMRLLRRRCFLRGIENGKRVYRIEWDLYPYILRKRNPRGREGEFWQTIDCFLNYDNWQIEAYANMEVLVQARVYYEYAARKFETIYGLIHWEHQKAGRVGAHSEAKTCDGYFSYEPIKAGRIMYEA